MLTRKADMKCRQVSITYPQKTQTRCKDNIFNREGGETLEHIPGRGGGCTIPRDIQGHVGQGSEQPDLFEDALTREFWIDDI